MSKINGKKITKKTQLHDIVDWNVDNLVFADSEPGIVPNSAPPIQYVRVNLLTLNHKIDNDGNIMKDENGIPLNDDTYGELIFKFDRMFCYGVSEILSNETKTVQGHTMSFALWSREGVTEREIQTSRKIEAIIKKCKEHLISIRKDGLKKPKLEEADLKEMDKLLYWKEDENGDKVQGQGPSFSPKLIEFKERVDKNGNKKDYQMCTVFYHEDDVDENGDPVEVQPLDFLSTKMNKKFCYARPAIKFESIFFGAKKNIQCKVTESDIAPMNRGPQRLLHGRHSIPINNKLTMNTSGLHPLLSGLNLGSSESSSSGGGGENVFTMENNDVDGKVKELSDDLPEERKIRKTVSRKKVVVTDV